MSLSDSPQAPVWSGHGVNLPVWDLPVWGRVFRDSWGGRGGGPRGWLEREKVGGGSGATAQHCLYWNMPLDCMHPKHQFRSMLPARICQVPVTADTAASFAKPRSLAGRRPSTICTDISTRKTSAYKVPRALERQALQASHANSPFTPSCHYMLICATRKRMIRQHADRHETL